MLLTTYANTTAYQALQAGQVADLPPGSIIVKENWMPDSTFDAATVMYKVDGYRLIEWGTNLRSRLLALPYGDQGLVARREDYVRAGGYPALPLMEDVALIRRLRRVTHVHLLDAAVKVSARRWVADGPLRRMLKKWVLMTRFPSGTSPERLVHRYRPQGAGHGVRRRN